MKRCLILGTFAFLLFATVACHNKSTSSPSLQLPTSPTLQQVAADALVIENGTVIIGNGADPILDGVVVIQGDRIVAVGPRTGFKIPSSAQEVDAIDGTILPGIFNAHVHGASHPAVRRVNFLLMGVTSVCDMGSPLEQMPQFAQDHKFGPAARGFKSGPIITVPGGYPDNIWHADVNYEVTTTEEARAAVADLVNRGADVIKIALEPGSKEDTWPMLDLGQVRTIVEEAHAHGKLVRAHVGLTKETDVLEIVLKSGVDVVEHVPLPVFSAREAYELIKDNGHYTMMSIDKERLARLAAQHVIMVPTLNAHTLWCESSNLPSWLKQGCFEFYEEPVHQFYSLGGTLALANDYGVDPLIEKGIPLREMQLLLEAGLTPMEVIEAGTRNAAKVCGHGDELGTLEPGKLADVIVVNGNPLEDIEVLNQPVIIIKSGQVVYPK